MIKEIGFGVIGLGMGASRCEAIANTDGAKLIAVADLNEERGKSIAEKYKIEWYKDYHELLKNKDIDVIIVMTPSGTHMEIAIESAKAGKNVIVTKPLEITLPRCDRIIEECKKKKVVLAVDFEMRYALDNVRIKKAIEENKLGKLILGEIRLKWYRSQAYYDAGGWRGTWKYDGGGSLMNQSIHLIDILQWFIGEVKSVYGTTSIMSHKIETEDMVLVLREGRKPVTDGENGRKPVEIITAIYNSAKTGKEIKLL